MLFDGIDYQPLADHLLWYCQMAGDDRIVLMQECGALNSVISHTFGYPNKVAVEDVENITKRMAHVYVMMNMVAPRLGVTNEMIQKEVEKWKTSQA